jgi:hypothetical protein
VTTGRLHRRLKGAVADATWFERLRMVRAGHGTLEG